jgi:glutathione S-transferase
MNRMRLHRFALSGHCHRAELMLSLLGLPFESVDVDLKGKEQKTPEFLRRNPLGLVPVLEDGAVTIPDSNAILVYLATKYDESGRWYPREAAGSARVQQWLSLAAGPLAFGAAAARVIKVFGAPLDWNRAAAIAADLFGHLERHLANREFLASEQPTVADVAMYSYTAHVPEGGISLAPYPAIRGWLARVEALPGFVPMRKSPIAA